MLYLVVATAFLLPSVLGNCCFPQKFSAQLMDSRSGERVYTQIDLANNEAWNVPEDPKSPVKFTMIDLTTSTLYTHMKDGTCKKVTEKINYFGKCIPKSAVKMGEAYFGNKDLNVEGFSFHAGVDDIVLVVSKDKCMPVMSVHGQAPKTVVTFFSNVSDDPKDQRALTADNSKCVEDSVVG